MRCVICGSRGITDYELLKSAIKESGFDITEVVSGCASGVDSLGERWAKENNLKIHKFSPQWDLYGRSAGFLRNKDMVKFVSPPDCVNGCVIAIWDGKSKGTAHTIRLAKEAEILTYTKKVS